MPPLGQLGDSDPTAKWRWLGSVEDDYVLAMLGALRIAAYEMSSGDSRRERIVELREAVTAEARGRGLD